MPEGGEPSFYYKLNNEEIKSMCPPVNLCILNHRPSTPTCHYNYYFENGPDIEKCSEKCEQRM